VGANRQDEADKFLEDDDAQWNCLRSFHLVQWTGLRPEISTTECTRVPACTLCPVSQESGIWPIFSNPTYTSQWCIYHILTQQGPPSTSSTPPKSARSPLIPSDSPPAKPSSRTGGLCLAFFVSCERTVCFTIFWQSTERKAIYFIMLWPLQFLNKREGLTFITSFKNSGRDFGCGGEKTKCWDFAS
jgi:hypothetical protein